MVYRKNLYSWESALRILIGLALIALAWFIAMDWPVRALLAASGVMLALTGAFGWCPMCAIAGRRLKSAEDH